jgi:hypothetical protein
MSSSECRRQSKESRILCVQCRERKARFRYRGEVRADRDHTLCFQCFRAQLNGVRSRRMLFGPWFALNGRAEQSAANAGRVAELTAIP